MRDSNANARGANVRRLLVGEKQNDVIYCTGSEPNGSRRKKNKKNTREVRHEIT